jgi:hypothetical protein
MLSTLRTAFAAAAIATVGLAGTASAHPGHGNPYVGPNKLTIKFCHPHFERKFVIFHGTRLILVYYVNRYCQKKLVRVIRLPFYRAAA